MIGTADRPASCDAMCVIGNASHHQETGLGASACLHGWSRSARGEL